MEYTLPTVDDLDRARAAFGTREPRDIFYRAASDLVQMALAGAASITVGEGLAVLLQSWNKQYYQYRPATAQHYVDVDRVLDENKDWLASVRERSIETVIDAELPDIGRLFNAFEVVLGPVGAAKSLHLMAPRFLPLWDREIARCYGLELGKRGSNPERYMKWIRIVKGQVDHLMTQPVGDRNLLKALDEYNYCHFTKGWI